MYQTEQGKYTCNYAAAALRRVNERRSVRAPGPHQLSISLFVSYYRISFVNRQAIILPSSS